MLFWQKYSTLGSSLNSRVSIYNIRSYLNTLLFYEKLCDIRYNRSSSEDWIHIVDSIDAALINIGFVQHSDNEWINVKPFHMLLAIFRAPTASEHSEIILYNDLIERAQSIVGPVETDETLDEFISDLIDYIMRYKIESHFT